LQWVITMMIRFDHVLGAIVKIGARAHVLHRLMAD